MASLPSPYVAGSLLKSLPRLSLTEQVKNYMITSFWCSLAKNKVVLNDPSLQLWSSFSNQSISNSLPSYEKTLGVVPFEPYQSVQSRVPHSSNAFQDWTISIFSFENHSASSFCVMRTLAFHSWTLCSVWLRVSEWRRVQCLMHILMM